MFKENEKARVKLSNELAVIDFSLVPIATPFNKENVLGTKQKIKTFNKFYNPDIWKNYNVITPKDLTPVN
jgi:hypothetical protein